MKTVWSTDKTTVVNGAGVKSTGALLTYENSMFTRFLIRIKNFVFHFEYLDNEKLHGFKRYQYKGIDTNPFNNQIAMPICDKMLYFIPTWLAPNAITLATFVLSLLQYLILAYYDYQLFESSIELSGAQGIPNWVWLFSGMVTLICIALDALDGKQARRIGACSPVGEILDHSIDTWRMTVQVVTCFYSIFGRLEYGLTAYRLMWLLMATQSLVAVIFWQQYLTGILVYSWGMDIMQYMIAEFYFHTWYGDGTDYWQGEGRYYGTNAFVTEIWAYFIIFGLAIPMQFYHLIKRQREQNLRPRSLQESLRPMCVPFAYFITAFILSQQNLYDSIIEEDPRASLWLASVVFCDIMWRLLVSNMSQTTPPRWNHLLSFFIACSVYWYFRPRSLLNWDGVTVQTAAVLATIIHFHLVLSTLNQMCWHFNVYFLSVKSRKLYRSDNV